MQSMVRNALNKLTPTGHIFGWKNKQTNNKQKDSDESRKSQQTENKEEEEKINSIQSARRKIKIKRPQHSRTNNNRKQKPNKKQTKMNGWKTDLEWIDTKKIGGVGDVFKWWVRIKCNVWMRCLMNNRTRALSMMGIDKLMQFSVCLPVSLSLANRHFFYPDKHDLILACMCVYVCVRARATLCVCVNKFT